MKRWCIINLSKIQDAGIPDLFPLNSEWLDSKYRPRVYYQNRDIAEEELFRLTEKYGEGFYLFEAVATCYKSWIAKKLFHLKKI